MTRNVTVDAQVELAGGVILQATTVQYTYHNGTTTEYKSHDVEGLADGLPGLAQLATALQSLPADGALDMDYEELLEFLMEWASDTAEQLEVPFTFTDRDGDTNTYTPAALWEASGSCSEWEQSAQYGYDYGWNI